jgi:hypothetical protein
MYDVSSDLPMHQRSRRLGGSGPSLGHYCDGVDKELKAYDKLGHFRTHLKKLLTVWFNEFPNRITGTTHHPSQQGTDATTGLPMEQTIILPSAEESELIRQSIEGICIPGDKAAFIP